LFVGWWWFWSVEKVRMDIGIGNYDEAEEGGGGGVVVVVVAERVRGIGGSIS
jgi:hypothetical protein